jgi:hypothetical protein
MKFFEGELRLIADCLRCVAPQKVAKQARGSADRMATLEEIEKYLEYLKQSHWFAPVGQTDARRLAREMRRARAVSWCMMRHSCP